MTLFFPKSAKSWLNGTIAFNGYLSFWNQTDSQFSQNFQSFVIFIIHVFVASDWDFVKIEGSFRPLGTVLERNLTVKIHYSKRSQKMYSIVVLKYM